MNKTIIIAEAGVNHNGDIKLAKKLIEKSKICGVDAVKFQKRDINLVYTKEELEKPRESPFGTTNREQKLGLEFKEKEYDEINKFCKEIDIEWFASAWDLNSLDFLKKYDLKFNSIEHSLKQLEAKIDTLTDLARSRKVQSRRNSPILMK